MTSDDPPKGNSVKSTIRGDRPVRLLSGFLRVSLNLTQSYYTCTRTECSKLVDPLVNHPNTTTPETR